MLFSQSIVGNSRNAQDQWQEVVNARDLAELHNSSHVALMRQAGMQVNDGLIPRELFQEFDNVTVERMRADDGDTFLNDLMGLSKSVGIEALVHRFRQASDAGNAQTSMSGQVGVRLDQTEYKYDGTIVPVHDTGFYRNWRERFTSAGFDALVDDQRESVATLRRHIADSFLDGNKDKDGNYIQVDGLTWKGMKNDDRVAAVDLGASGLNFDFTSGSTTGAQNRDKFKEVRDVLRITNNCPTDAVYYISREIETNWERRYSDQYDAKTILEELKGLAGVADIKVSSKLSGNEIMAFPLDADKIRPVVGMGINTVALPRPLYNSNYEFAVWGAIGFEVREDYFGRTCALFAN